MAPMRDVGGAISENDQWESGNLLEENSFLLYPIWVAYKNLLHALVWIRLLLRVWPFDMISTPEIVSNQFFVLPTIIPMTLLLLDYSWRTWLVIFIRKSQTVHMQEGPEKSNRICLVIPFLSIASTVNSTMTAENWTMVSESLLPLNKISPYRPGPGDLIINLNWSFSTDTATNWE